MFEKVNIELKKAKVLMIFVLTISIFIACDNYKPNYAEPTVNQEKMAAMMVDLHILEAYLQNVEAAKRDSIKSTLYDQLFKTHQVNATEFYKNQKIYFSHSETIEPLYDKVLEKIEREYEKGGK
jgi:hypothetical protein